jgi:zinc/manganese transport system substrate-binding protein
MRRTGLILGIAALTLSGCAASTQGTAIGPRSTAVISVVAAENTWGSLAAQLGGHQAHVVSIVSDPNADPHEYESNAVDARDVASANLVIVNGAGYDTWAQRLLSSQQAPRRDVIDVAALVHKKAGDNPHLWYDPAYVSRAIDEIAAAYERIEPAERSYFAQRQAILQRAFAPERQELGLIAGKFHGRTVGATETIVQYLASYVHLRLVTPEPFMQAVSEGTDPPAQSLVTIDHQIRSHAFGVLLYNTQTVTPLTTRIRSAAQARGIAVVGVSETIEPPSLSFETWMTGQLRRLAAALAPR